MLGEIVKVTVDRPLGSYHPKHKDMYYPVNYGYVAGIMAPDGEEQDAYILGVDEPVAEFTGRVIAPLSTDLMMWKKNGWWHQNKFPFQKRKSWSRYGFRSSTLKQKSECEADVSEFIICVGTEI